MTTRSAMHLLIAGLVVTIAACSSASRTTGSTTTTTTTTSSSGNVQRGYATWYGKEAHGGPTASGERFDRFKMTAAHRTIRLGTHVRVTNERNGRSAIVRINDRGPYGKQSRIIDVSEAAARTLGMIDAGVVPVTVEILHETR